MDEFHAIGACGIVMDVRTGEVIAMVSLPDYDANKFGEATADERFNRAVTGMYEPGSTFKLQTAAMTLDSGQGHLWSTYDAAHNIKIGRFTITDFEGKHRVLSLPEVIAYSSNLGAAHMAQQMGADRQRAWLQQMGMFNRIGIELPEQGLPIVHPASTWKEAVTMTVGFGHGIAVSPLHVVRGTAAIANGGVVLRPTLLAPEPDMAPRTGPRVMQQSTSDTMRKLMRLVVTDGYGKPADVPGYFVGRQDRDGGEELGPRLQEARQYQRVHERVSDERAALRGLLHAGRAEGQRQHGRVLDRWRGQRARGRPGHRADRADARADAGDRQRRRDPGEPGDAAARCRARPAGVTRRWSKAPAPPAVAAPAAGGEQCRPGHGSLRCCASSASPPRPDCRRA